MESMSPIRLHKLYIKGTEEKALVIVQTIQLCTLTNAVKHTLHLENHKIHITTIVLKHLYDSKPAEEYEFLLKHLVSIVRYPDQAYENKGGKRGQFCLVKRIKTYDYFCSIERITTINAEGQPEEMNYVVTAFRLRKTSYLNNYTLLRSWKGDSPSS